MLVPLRVAVAAQSRIGGDLLGLQKSACLEVRGEVLGASFAPKLGDLAGAAFERLGFDADCANSRSSSCSRSTIARPRIGAAVAILA